jgi:hypothetical protein
MEGGAVRHNIERTIPAKFALIWFSGFRGDLNVIFYQNEISSVVNFRFITNQNKLKF